MDSSVEPMDIDRSASSTSKMDISFNDTDPDVYVLDDDDGDNNFGYSNNHISSTEALRRECSQHFDNTFNNITVRIKHEKLDEPSPTQIQTNTTMFEDVHNSQQGEKVIIEDKPKPKTSIKTYHIKKEPHIKKELHSKGYNVLLCVVVILLSIILFQIITFKCSENIHEDMLKESFRSNLFGQVAAADKIIETLKEEENSKLIFFYGGTGVGKTFAVSTILDSTLKGAANIYHYTMPTFADSFSPELMIGLTVCQSSIIIIDDLNRNDMHIVSHIETVFAKSRKLGKIITVILVYNCDIISDNFIKKCDDSFLGQLSKSFEHVEVKKYYVKFEALKQEHLKKCIERELGYRKVSEQEMEHLMKNFNVTLDGCKGVYTKVKFHNVI